MTHTNLTKKEQENLQAVEDAVGKGGYHSVLTPERKHELEQAASKPRQRKQLVTLRVAPADLAKLKRKAEDEGLAPTTYMASVLHKIAVQ
jgi:predicted DNA binding CopG/RHH family protein